MEDTFLHNDAIREEEHVCTDTMREEERVRMDTTREKERVRMAQNTILILSESSFSDESLETLSVESSGSGRRKITNKPVISSNKSSTFPAKNKSDIEETPLKQPHQDAFTPNQENLERVMWLHIKYGFLDTEYLFMLPKTWL